MLVCKRWKGVAENSKLWEDKKLVLEEGENMTLSCAVEVARRIKIQTIQAIGLSIDQVKKVALAVAQLCHLSSKLCDVTLLFTENQSTRRKEEVWGMR